ncbi:glycoside hydrolase [Cryphonectria parasitica EP155]|uniref:Probable glucan endo-1,3-beta-glucosidase eglC n=1 Tax=Cryphonectria parasitica (strain ATCC 38755 / EP155) TaxID=660469 RepID=A0A9P5CNC7_CRYP1|nr:glycoside hydrolase [Cryphonectria parasitica EP155]KAF3765319.1 glycoside hydrolase [Cryphonectria parasitica EP155]
MVCVKKSASAVAAVATAGSSVYQASTGVPTATSSTSVPTTASLIGSNSTSVANTTSAVATTGSVTAANSGIKGFNYAAFFLDYTAKQQSDFEYEFKRAQELTNTSGWTSARLYTMIQYDTTSDPIEAIPAAIATNTSLLLGLWVSGSDSAITNEIAALQAAITTYGTDFTNLVQGISVGSEDLYRDAEGDASDPGNTVDNLIDYISQVRTAISGTGLADVPVGHVDTYDSFENATNTKIIEYIDWIGFDGYPYWESSNGNAIENAHDLFYTGLNKTTNIAQGKPVWVSETGWPATGENYGEAVASAENARTYWKEIACELIAANINLWWYDLQESQEAQANPDFGIFPAGDLMTVEQRYDLSC